MKPTISLLLIFCACSLMLNAQKSMTPDRYTPELLWKLGRVSEPQVSPDNKTVLYGVSWYNLEENKGNRDLYSIPIAGGTAAKVTSIKGSESNGIYRPDGLKIAYLSSQSGSSQIWEANNDGSNALQISAVDGDITGFSYSPKGNAILYTVRIKLDKSVNDLYPDLPKANARLESDLMYRHWDSWSDFSYSHIFIAQIENGKLGKGIDIMEGERFDSPMLPWGGMEQICWRPDGTMVAYTCKKMTGKDYSLSTNSEIYLYNIAAKATTNISNGLNGYDQDPVFSPDGNKIVWRSMERDGFEADKDRIMIYDLSSKSQIDYSRKFDQSSNNFVWSADGRSIYFLSGHHGTVQVYSLNTINKEIKKITEGDHDYLSISLCGKDLVGSRQSMLQPTELFKISLNGIQTKLTSTNDSILKNIRSAKVESRWITTTDKKKMLVWVIYPPDFSPDKKYPALLFCEGGPQTMVSQFFSYRWNFQMMAANDYIVIAPNRRGLPGFGQEWNDQISGDYGGQNMKDYLVAVDSLSTEPYIDKNRMGAVGASYGGFSVLWLAGHHEKRFKAFISHCGMFNLEDQYLTTEEMWFVNWDLGGPYWDKNNPKVNHSYANSPHKFVDKWDTPIMIVEGENDYRIPFTQGMAAFNAAQLRGIPSIYLHFPEENHWVLRPQNSVLWQRQFFDWLNKWLK
ncbi:MAG: S9 family peptidase [Bacteroidales bacterium]|nr:S9 family peptidase [Bacteroidales bacterium]